MKSVSKVALIACAVLLFPKQPKAGIVEGALIGAGIGAIVGLVMNSGQTDTGTARKTNSDSSFLADSLKLGTKFSFSFINDSSSSLKIKYSYAEFFSGYEAYTKDKRTLADTLTAFLISRQLEKIGGSRVVDSMATADVLVRYRQLLGWDMGDIVKRMIICAELNPISSNSTGPICVEFDERTIFNTHPTQAGTVERLVELLTSNKNSSKLNSTKYRRFVVPQ